MREESFAEFYRQHYRLILTVAQQRLNGLTHAEDVTAEVFRIAWQHHEDGKPLSLKWAYSVLRNLMGNEYRRVRREDAFVESMGPLLTTSGIEPEIDDALVIRAAIRDLPVADRELISMAYWEDLTNGEIASIIGVRSGTVRVRLHRARKKLETILRSAEFTRGGDDG